MAEVNPVAVSIPAYPAEGNVVALNGLLVADAEMTGQVALPEEPDTCRVNVAVGRVVEVVESVIVPAAFVTTMPDPAVIVVAT